MENSINKKLKVIIDFSLQKDSTAGETKNRILELFKDELKFYSSSINQAYYKIKNDTYVIDNGTGLMFEIIEGPGDVYGQGEEWDDMTIAIVSPFSKGENLYLFADGYRNQELDKKQMYETLDKLLDVDMSIVSVCYGIQLCEGKSLKIYNSLDLDLKTNENVMKVVCSELLKYAKSKSEDQKNYSDISPYGGLDVFVQHPYDIYIEELKKDLSVGNSELFKYAINFLSKEPEIHFFLKKEIEICKQQLYFIENEDAYNQIYEMESEINQKTFYMHFKPSLQELDDKGLEDKIYYCHKDADYKYTNYIEESEKKVRKLSDQLRTLENKKYNVLTRFTQQHKDEFQNLRIKLDLNNCLDEQSSVTIFDFLSDEYDALIEEQKHREMVKTIKGKYPETKELKYDYKDYSKDNFCEFYDYYDKEDGYQKSMARLKANKPYLEERWITLQEIEKKSNEYRCEQLRKADVDSLSNTSDSQNELIEQETKIGRCR